MTAARAMFAELVGVFALTLVGAGSIIATEAVPGGGGGLLTVALAHGLILGVMVSATMHVSGGQINPAVSIGLAVIRRQTWARASLFVAGQVAGAVLAAGLLQGLLGDVPAAEGGRAADVVRLGATLGDPAYRLEAGPVFGLELIATFLLMVVMMGTVVDSRGVGRTMSVGGLAVGLTLTACMLFIGPFTGGSLNPARSFGPALLAGAWDLHWVYWGAPAAGAVLAAVLYDRILGGGRRPEPG
ncbi:MAG: aquaporin [Planctomycetota bacterium]|jgi:aquaporin TIP